MDWSRMQNLKTRIAGGIDDHDPDWEAGVEGGRTKMAGPDAGCD